jgi:hypothetical protein
VRSNSGFQNTSRISASPLVAEYRQEQEKIEAQRKADLDLAAA